jgi:hypothetical protein
MFANGLIENKETIRFAEGADAKLQELWDRLLPGQRIQSTEVEQMLKSGLRGKIFEEKNEAFIVIKN